MLFNFDLSTVYAKRASNNRPLYDGWKRTFVSLRHQENVLHVNIVLIDATQYKCALINMAKFVTLFRSVCFYWNVEIIF